MTLQMMCKAKSWVKVVFPLAFASSIVVCASHPSRPSHILPVTTATPRLKCRSERSCDKRAAGLIVWRQITKFSRI